MQENTSKLIINFSTILLCLIPLLMITGPFLPDLFLVVILICTFFLNSFKKDFLLLKNKYLLFFLLINFVIIIISIFSQNLISIKSGIFYFRFGFFALAAFYLIYLNEQIIKYLLYIFIIIFISLFLDSIYQFYNLENIIGFKYINENNFRITSFFGKDEILGSYIARFFPLLIFLIIYNKNVNNIRDLNIFILILTIISFSLVMLSGERTSIALLLLSIIFIFFSSIKIRKILVIPIVLSLIIFTISVSTSERLKGRLIDSTLNQLGFNDQSKRIHVFSKTYEGHYVIAYKMFLEKPLFGHGPKMFRIYCSKKENYYAPNACTTHPHNFYAQIISETGIFGFIVLFGLFLTIVLMFLKNLRHQLRFKKQLYSDEAISILASFFMTLFPFLPSGNFFNNWLSLIVYYPLGFLIFLIYKKKLYV